MKKITITYWVTTSIIALMMLFSGVMYLTSPEAKDGFAKVGFPDFFRIELAFAKIIGAILLIVPTYWRIKEWVYAGFGIVFISAVIAHISIGDTFGHTMMPAIFAGILVVSYITYTKRCDCCCTKSSEEGSESKCC